MSLHLKGVLVDTGGRPVVARVLATASRRPIAENRSNTDGSFELIVADAALLQQEFTIEVLDPDGHVIGSARWPTGAREMKIRCTPRRPVFARLLDAVAPVLRGTDPTVLDARTLDASLARTGWPRADLDRYVRASWAAKEIGLPLEIAFALADEPDVGTLEREASRWLAELDARLQRAISAGLVSEEIEGQRSEAERALRAFVGEPTQPVQPAQPTRSPGPASADRRPTEPPTDPRAAHDGRTLLDRALQTVPFGSERAQEIERVRGSLGASGPLRVADLAAASVVSEPEARQLRNHEVLHAITGRPELVEILARSPGLQRRGAAALTPRELQEGLQRLPDRSGEASRQALALARSLERALPADVVASRVEDRGEAGTKLAGVLSGAGLGRGFSARDEAARAGLDREAQELGGRVDRLRAVAGVGDTGVVLTALLDAGASDAAGVLGLSTRELEASLQEAGAVDAAALAGTVQDRAQRAQQIAALPTLGETSARPANAGDASTWADLFPGDGWEDVPDWASVLGPGAYLIDLLGYCDELGVLEGLEGTPTQPRRPDILDLPLSEENTSGEVPTLDLVNEILEHALVHGPSAAPAVRSTLHPDVARVVPEHLDPEASAALAATDFPWSVDALPTEELSAWLELAGVPLSELVEALIPVDVQRPDAVIARELNLSPRSVDALNGRASPEAIAASWGLSSPDALPTLATPDALASAAGVSLHELDALLATETVQREGSIARSGAAIVGLTTATADAIRRVLALQRAAGLSLVEADALLSLRTGKHSTEALDVAALVIRIARRLGRPVVRVAGWLGELPHALWSDPDGVFGATVQHPRHRDHPSAWAFVPRGDGLGAEGRSLSEHTPFLASCLHADEDTVARLVEDQLVSTESVRTVIRTIELLSDLGWRLDDLLVLSSPEALSEPRELLMFLDRIAPALRARTPPTTAEALIEDALAAAPHDAAPLDALASSLRLSSELAAWCFAADAPPDLPRPSTHGLLDRDTLERDDRIDRWLETLRAVDVERQTAGWLGALAMGEADPLEHALPELDEAQRRALLEDEVLWGDRAGDPTSLEAAERLSALCAHAKRLGITPDEIVLLASSSDVPAAAASARERALALLPEGQIEVLASATADRIRSSRRDRLVATLLARPEWDHLRTPEDLRSWFLLDPLVGGCHSSTRVLAATAAVQTYLHRCLLGIEGSPKEGAVRQRWSLLERYRVWEANKKILLWPENWLEPSLRHDRSDAFRLAQEALDTGDLSAEHAERAFETYLGAVQTMSSVEVMATSSWGWRTEEGDYGEIVSLGYDRIYLLARSRSAPHSWYLRHRNDSVWEPWHVVDAGIQGQCVSVVWWADQGRELVVWAEITETSSQDSQDSEPTRRAQMHLWFTERRGRRWTPKRRSDRPLGMNGGRPLQPWANAEEYLSFLMLEPVIEPGRLRIRVILSGADATSDEGSFVMQAGSSCLTLLAVEADAPEQPFEATPQPPQGAAFGAFWPAGFRDGRFHERPGESALIGAGPITQPLLSQTGDSAYTVTANSVGWGDKNELQTWQQPFVFQEGPHATLIEWLGPGFRVQHLHDKFVGALAEQLSAGGLEGLFASLEQIHEQINPVSSTVIPAIASVLIEGWDADAALTFGLDQPPGLTRWELLFHLPFAVAIRLLQAERFEEARRWLHLIFDPTQATPGDPDSLWRFPPFRAPGEAYSASLSSQLERWSEQPLTPHAVARLRWSAFQRAVVMRYLDCLIGWGDQSFREERRESVQQAQQLYTMAQELLGPRPEPQLRNAPREVITYRTAQQQAAPAGQEWIGASGVDLDGFDADDALSLLGLPQGLSIPPNPHLLSYWDTLDDRLYKIRNCLTLDGRRAALPLFEAPLDPGALAAVVARGGLAALSAAPIATSQLRFRSLLDLSRRLLSDARSLSASYQAAIERGDAEALAQLRAAREASLLDEGRQAKIEAFEAAQIVLDRLEVTRTRVEEDLTFTTGQLHGDVTYGRSPAERIYLRDLGEAHRFKELASGYGIVANLMSLLPQTHVSFPPGVEWGGQQLVNAARAFEGVWSLMSSMASDRAAQAEIDARHERRAAQWRHGADQLRRQLEEIEIQRAEAAVGVTLAQRALEDHDRQRADAAEIAAVLQQRFTNAELYSWLQGQLGALLQQTLDQARDAAQMALRAARWELVDDTFGDSLDLSGGWDPSRRGLLAAEALMQQLNALELAYTKQLTRRPFVKRSISLAALHPLALLELQRSGVCAFEISEATLAGDHPHAHARVLRRVGITVPTVVGPHTPVNGRLERTDLGSGTPRALHPGISQQILISTGQLDQGVDPQAPAELYAPFEGSWVASRWQLSIPAGTNRFDLASISDVIVHLEYTCDLSSPPDPQPTMPAALGEAYGSRTPVFLSLRRHFASEWSRARQNGTFEATVVRGRLPWLEGSDVVQPSELWLLAQDTAQLQGELFGVPLPTPTPQGELGLQQWTVPLQGVSIDEQGQQLQLSGNLSELSDAWLVVLV